MNAGVFYDLLPEGCSVDPESVIGLTITNDASSSLAPQNYNYFKNQYSGSNKLDPGYYDVRFEQNWKNSGRTMMVIKYGLPENQELAIGVRFLYLLHNTYENVMEHGTTVENDVAFVDLTENRTPPNSISGTLSVITEKGYYQDLDNQHSGNIGYAKANTHYIPVDAYSWGFNKSVQTVSEYEYQGEVLPNSLYTYRLTYSQSEYAISNSLVFFDVLEGGSDTKGEDGNVQHNKSEWHGTLEYVNTGAAEEKLTDGSTTIHCKPVIYYSTKDRSAFTGSDWDVSNTATWTTEKPSEAGTITAVAVDCSKNEDGSPFVMKGKQSLEMFITMRSPMTAEAAGKTAYNEGVIWAKHEDDETATPEYDNAAVMMQDVEPTLNKTTNHGTGTVDHPEDVFKDDELTYKLSVTNSSDKLTLNDIVVEDTVPANLSIDAPNIMVHFGNPENAIKVSVSPRVSMKRKGRDLIFTVSSLLPEETVHVDIPTIVLTDNGTLTNTARITSVNGVKKEVSSDTTYHEAQPTDMAVKKTGVGGLGIAGAQMQLLDMEGNILKEWVSTEKTEHFVMEPGDYVVHEVSAPDGYLLADDITVNLSRNGVLTLKDTGEVVSPATMVDDWTKILIEKNNSDGEPLPGAGLAIYNQADVVNGKPAEGTEPVERWTSTEEPHEILGVLGAGKSYTLVEEFAPEGYGTARPITFTVRNDGEEQRIVMVDPKDGIEVEFEKTDEDGKPLIGAELQIQRLNDDGPQDEGFENLTWTSEETNEVFRLEPGTYIMHEISAPEGYALAEDIQFVVTADGKAEVMENISGKQTVTWYDGYFGGILKQIELEDGVALDEFMYPEVPSYENVIFDGWSEPVVNGNSISITAVFTLPDGTAVKAARAELEQVPVITMTDVREAHKLTVSKVVAGSMGDKTKDFHFKLQITGLTNAEFIKNDEETGIAEFIDECYEFTLAHGEWISFILPYGSKYKVIELDGESDGYTVEGTNTESMITGTDMAASFTNTKKGEIPTGFKASTGLSFGFGISSGLLALILIFYRLQIHRKKK